MRGNHGRIATLPVVGGQGLGFGHVRERLLEISPGSPVVQRSLKLSNAINSLATRILIGQLGGTGANVLVVAMGNKFDVENVWDLEVHAPVSNSLVSFY